MTTEAHQPPTDAVIRDLQAYNAAFIQANRDDNPSLMRPWMHLPVTRYRPDRTSVAATLEDIDAMYRTMVDGLKGTGYHHSVLSDFQVDLINSGTALVRCHGERLRADGSAVQTFDTAYLMAKTHDRWQVASLISRP